MSKKSTMTIEEFKKLAGFASGEFDDVCLADMLSRLELIAQIYINKIKDASITSDSVPKSTKGHCNGVSPSHNRR